MISFKKDNKVIGLDESDNKWLKNITTKDLTKTFNLSGTNLDIEIKDAMYGELNGEEILLDEIPVENRIKELISTLSKTTSKYNKMPKKIVIYNERISENISENSNNQEQLSKENNKQDASLFNAYVPKWNFDNVYIKKEARENILTALNMIKFKDKLFNEWNLKGNKDTGRSTCLNFWGKPGTGKSMAAEAIANYLDKKLLIVNYAELESKYVGETPKNIKKVFEKAKEENAVIVFDEADSFLGKRLTNVTQSADYGVNVTRSVMLIELENFDGIVIFTTNLLDNYDDAFKRRILANIEFELPDEEGRKSIWDVHLPKEMPIKYDVTIEILAKKFENISGADIKDIVLMAATETLRHDRDMVSLNEFEYGYNIIISRYNKGNKSLDNVKVVTERISEEQYNEEIKKNKENKENINE
jgi:SpoVK/Ycf46/Vps4 family AAA+-type ATPase